MSHFRPVADVAGGRLARDTGPMTRAAAVPARARDPSPPRDYCCGRVARDPDQGLGPRSHATAHQRPPSGAANPPPLPAVAPTERRTGAAPAWPQAVQRLPCLLAGRPLVRSMLCFNS